MIEEMEGISGKQLWETIVNVRTDGTKNRKDTRTGDRERRQDTRTDDRIDRIPGQITDQWDTRTDGRENRQDTRIAERENWGDIRTSERTIDAPWQMFKRTTGAPIQIIENSERTLEQTVEEMFQDRWQGDWEDISANDSEALEIAEQRIEWRGGGGGEGGGKKSCMEVISWDLNQGLHKLNRMADFMHLEQKRGQKGRGEGGEEAYTVVSHKSVLHIHYLKLMQIHFHTTEVVSWKLSYLGVLFLTTIVFLHTR